MDRNLRIRTNVSQDKVLNVNLQQDVDFLEILSIKLRQENTYRIQEANYGVVVGRVLANDSFGIENAKVSVFVPLDDVDVDNEDIEDLYPFTSIISMNGGVRYNTLPDEKVNECHRAVGSFPNKRLVLDNDAVLEVYDKYWKYTTVTNSAGDYMLFGVPVGSQQIHTDVDISDIGLLSQKPRDLIYKGYSISQFENPSQFNKSTNLDTLPQIMSQTDSLYVYPFWGDASNSTIAITRCDIKIDYKFETTCVFLGSVFTDSESDNALGSNCYPPNDMGLNSKLGTNTGHIETIRKTIDGKVEELTIQGNELIDNDGVFCYQIPMNLDYISTDEFGNIVPSTGINKGIPTRARVRFRFTIDDTGEEDTGKHRAKILVPNNPKLEDGSVIPRFDDSEGDLESYYEFGDNTPENCFRDLLWNKVYTVKMYIPRIQRGSKSETSRFTGIKQVAKGDNSNNPIPYNKFKFNLPKAYRRICRDVENINDYIDLWNAVKVDGDCWSVEVDFDYGYEEIIGHHNGQVLAPGCDSRHDREKVAEYYNLQDCDGLNTKKPGDLTCVVYVESAVSDIIKGALMTEYGMYDLQFYNDWINGSLYFPLWFWKKMPATRGWFGTWIGGHHSVNQYCNSDVWHKKKNVYFGEVCSLDYENDSFDVHIDDRSIETKAENLSDDIENASFNKYHRWHKKKRMMRIDKGIIKEHKNMFDVNVYYYSPGVQIEPRWAYGYYGFVRLFSTDIVLLGSLNDNDSDGVPKVTSKYPSTTANILPLQPITRTIEDETKDGIADFDKKYVRNVIEMSGLDFGFNPYREPFFFKYDRGLLGEVGCADAATKMKSCINVERMCELAVSNDSEHELSGATTANHFKTRMIVNNDDSWYETDVIIPDSIRPDGMISVLDIENMDTRINFATMNSRRLLIERGTGKNTYNGYDTYKFNYLYVNDFDGRLKSAMELYATDRGIGAIWKDADGNIIARTNTITHYDNKSEDYITFRMGAEGSNVGSQKRRHFYYHYNGKYSFPLYDNSFYFYFGLKKGSTAIDKFYKMYYSDCVADDAQSDT